MGTVAEGRGAARSALFVSGIDGFCHRYGVLHRARAVAACGFDVRVMHFLDPRLADASRGAAWIFLYRVPATAAVEELLASTAGSGVARVGLLDDRLYAPAEHAAEDEDAASRARREEGVPRYRAVLESCDALLAATPALAADARGLGPPVSVHADSLSDDEWDLAQAAVAARNSAARDVVRLGYASGTPTHDRDLTEMAGGIAAALAAEPSLRLSLRGPVRLPDVLSPFADRIERAELVDWTALPEALAATDIQLAPLAWRETFARCKGANKFLEAAAVGVPVVASPTPMHEAWIEHGRNGLLATGTAAVSAAILELAREPARRAALGAAARETARTHFSEGARAGEMERFLAAPPSAGAKPSGWEVFRPQREGETPGQVALEPDARPVLPNLAVTAEPSPPLATGAVLTQEFLLAGPGLERLDVHAVTYDQDLRHLLEFRLLGPEGELHAAVELDAAILPDRRFFAFSFEALPCGGLHRLEIRARGTGAGNATSFGLTHTAADRPAASMDGRALAGALALRGFARWQSRAA